MKEVANALTDWASRYEGVQIQPHPFQQKRTMPLIYLYRFCDGAEGILELLQTGQNEPLRALRESTIYQGHTSGLRRRILINVRAFYKHEDQRVTSTVDMEYAKVREYHEITKADLQKICRTRVLSRRSLARRSQKIAQANVLHCGNGPSSPLEPKALHGFTL